MGVISGGFDVKVITGSMFTKKGVSTDIIVDGNLLGLGLHLVPSGGYFAVVGG